MTDVTYDERLRRAFNTWADGYEQEVEQKLLDRWYSYDQLAAFVSVWCEEANHVFEIGCGPGTLGRRVRGRLRPLATLKAVDVSDKMVALASSTGSYDSVERGSADKFTFPQETEVVFTAFVIHSVEDVFRLIGNILALPRFARLIVIDLFPRTEAIARQSAAHSAHHEFGAPERYVTITRFAESLRSLPARVVASGTLGRQKDYVHGFFVIERGPDA